MTARCCAGPRHSAETPPVGYASPSRVKRCPFGVWNRLPQGGNGRPAGSPGHGDEPVDCRRGRL